MKLLRTFLVAGLVATASSAAFAGYSISRVDGGNDTLVQGRWYSYQVTSSPALFDSVDLRAVGALADYDITVGNGVQIGPTQFRVDSTGKLNFLIRYHKAPGTVQLTVTNSNDSQVTTTITQTLQRYPVTFQITPNNPTITAGVPFPITITALDGTGAFVSAFADSVQVTDSQMGDVTPVPDTAFVNGQATVNVTVRAGDMNNKTRLTVDLVGNQYYDPALPAPHLVPAATFTTPDLNFVPGAFKKLVMLFPGETLTPGIGKSGAVDTQVANQPVSAVTVWRVDQYFNPIPTAVPTTVSFLSSVNTDTMPADRAMNVPPLQVLGAATDPFKFLTNGTRTITARADGDSTTDDTSVVPVAPGNNNTYAFTVQPGANYTTDGVITVQITAMAGGQVLDTLYGTLPGAKLSARILTTPTEESADWVDTNPSTIVPDNVVNFNAGVANVNLVVTKRASQVQLHFQDQFGVGVLSNIFAVDVGALDHVQLTIRGLDGVLSGETFTAGTYPGNSGTPPQITAGQTLTVEARLVDRHFNVVSGPAVDGIPVQIQSDVPNSYVTATNAGDPNVAFDNTGTLLYQVGFDKAFHVTMRTAGTFKRFKATSNFNDSTGSGDFWSSTTTVIPASYNKVVIAAPGETLRPGSFFANGKEGTPSQQGAGISFPLNVYLTDQYWNPINNGPFSNVTLNIAPVNAQSFISGVTLGQPTTMPGSSRAFTTTLAENSNVTATDATDNTKTQTVAVPVGAGALDHFTLTFQTPGTKEAGVPYQVTIQAQDKFNQLIPNFNGTVDLDATNAPGTLTPATISVANGSWTGDITNFAAGTGVQTKMTLGGISSLSSAFDVTVNSQGFKKLLLLGPDEVQKPGTATGKTGTNAPHQVGTAVTVTAVACDLYYNKLNVSGNQVQFLSNQYAVFSPSNGTIATGQFATTLVMHAAKTHTITAIEPTLSLMSTTTIAGLPGPYARVQILAPGEVADDGNDTTGGKVALSSPTAQKVSIPFTVTLRAVDQFFNLVNTYNGGDTLLTLNTVNGIFIPANNTVGGPTPRAFVNGVVTRDVLIGQEGTWNLDARDQADLTKLGQTDQIPVNPGPTYNFVVPSTVNAGVPFSATISLEQNGVPLSGYNQSIFLDAYLPSGGPATGSFNPDGSKRQYVMSNGQVTINDLQYAYVEDIQIRLTDNFGRVAFSGTIRVDPSGLKYVVTAPASAIAGPPQTFPVTVELHDQTTDTLIRNARFNHTIGVSVVSLLNPPAAGTISITEAPLNLGVASFTPSYSKAEQIKLQITDKNNAFGVNPGFSGAIQVNPDSYKKLLILAPGETHTPGIYQSPTGKTGTPNALDKSVAQVFQVRGVDQNWNTVTSLNSGSIIYTASDGSTSPTNPLNQGAALVGGQTAGAITFNTAGNITVTVSDNQNAAIIPQSVQVLVAGTFFDFPVLPTQQNTGVPFSMTITLKDTTGNTVPANGPITLQALHTDGTPATGLLDVTSANLVNGNVTINNERYNIAEDIRLKVTGHDTTTISNTIHFVPRSVFYVYDTIPSSANVNEPFEVVIQAYDQDTGTKIINMNRPNLPLLAYSAATSLPVTGNFIPSTINIVNGVGRVSAVYDKAETIYLVLQDPTTIFDPAPFPTQLNYPSPGTIKVNPGLLAQVNLADWTMQSNETRTLTLTARDRFNNTIPSQKISITIDNPEPNAQMYFNNQLNTYVGTTDNTGAITVEFRPHPDCNGVVTITLRDLTNPDRGWTQIVRATVLGLTRGARQDAGLGGNRVPVDSHMFMDLTNLSAAGGVFTTHWRLDGGPWQTYDPAVGISGFTIPKVWKLEWYTEACYPSVDPTCANPISELTLNGGPNVMMMTSFMVEDKFDAFPSPFNPKTGGYATLQFPLGVPSTVETDIYDLFGQKVWHNEQPVTPNTSTTQPFGQVLWTGVSDSGTTVANGGYIVVLKIAATGEKLRTKLLVVR